MSYYTVEKKITDAAFPRAPGSTILIKDKLKIVYNKYKSTKKFPADAIKINLIFCHGTGMNKSVWKYHIKRLYELAHKSNWNLNSVVSIDAAGHGDSAMVNKGQLGWCFKWDDGGRDVIQVLKHELITCGDFVNDAFNKNIAVGHSLGGFMVMMASFYEPNLFDSIIIVEGVLYSADSMTARFTKIFSKIASLIIDEFDSKEDFDEYFTKFSFSKTMKPEILKDLMEDELYTQVDPKSKETKYKAKSSSDNQMTTYISSGISIKLGMAILSYLQVPVCHVIGTKAVWNPPESIPFIRNAIPKPLLTMVDIEDGTHMVNVEKPDETIAVVETFVKGRFDAALENKDYVPEVKYKGDREKILRKQWELAIQGKMEEATTFKARL